MCVLPKAKSLNQLFLYSFSKLRSPVWNHPHHPNKSNNTVPNFNLRNFEFFRIYLLPTQSVHKIHPSSPKMNSKFRIWLKHTQISKIQTQIATNHANKFWKAPTHTSKLWLLTSINLSSTWKINIGSIVASALVVLLAASGLRSSQISFASQVVFLFAACCLSRSRRFVENHRDLRLW